MWTDIVDLRDFYAGSLGQMSRRLIRRRLRALWPDLRGLAVLGLGYTVPYLLPFREEAERVIGIMPAGQGVLRWPPEGPGLVALADESELPLPDRSVDRVLMIHCLEFCEQLRPALREVWRVLADGGRLLVVVPNRRGLWARFERTPFGHGRPYSESQINRLLRDNMFLPEAAHAALFAPPTHSRMLLRSAGAFEEMGDRWFRAFGGVIVIEASKQIYAMSSTPPTRRRRAYLPVPGRLHGSLWPHG